MKKFLRQLVILLSIINSLCLLSQFNLQKNPLNEETVHDINVDVEGNANYKKAEFEFLQSETYHYFKYEYNTLPSSKASIFRVDFDQFSISMTGYKVYCTNVASSTTDSQLIEILKGLDSTKSSCIEVYKSTANYDSLVKLDETKLKVGIILISNSEVLFSGRILFRVTERILDTDESKPMEDESLSLVPFTINIPNFRELSKSKILFYSYSRVLQMYHVEGSSPYPEMLFSGNILSVYTNPNMVRQKYQGASIMILINYPYEYSNDEETFKFQVKLFESNYLLDYYVSSNEEGRPLYTPLLINMTECSSPYYVILNYNRQESSKTLILDQIYGKISSLSVATEFTQSTWDEMLNKDMEIVDINTREHILKGNSKNHMDVYKIECQLPLMFNFYYIEESYLISKMNFGDINIFTLKAYESVNVPFFSGMSLPQIIIEIFNPVTNPVVIVEAQEETVYQENTLIEITPMTLSDGINIKERGGLSNTRIIIKVGYSSLGWTKLNDYIKYKKDIDTYLFEFPNTIKRYNYTFANLITSGTNTENNVKYCFTTNIGAALKPSSENCYRVSNDNPYTLKAYNPLIMYKDYEYDEGLSYYITFTQVTTATSFNIEAKVETYDTNTRNYERINNKIVISSSGNYSSILTPPKNKDPYIFVQVQVCDNVNSIKTKIIKPLTNEVIEEEKTISTGTKNYFTNFPNYLIDTEFYAIGNQNTNVFLRMVGIPSLYQPSFNDNYQITFDIKTNTLNIESPLTTTESIKYIVLVDKENVITNKKFTLCDFVNTNVDSLVLYTKTVISSNKLTAIQLNFNKAKINVGEKFEAIVYIEQQTKGQMVFLSDIYQGTVGEIDIETIHEIDEIYSLDTNYAYKTIDGVSTEASYYFTYLPSEILSVPIGAFSLELDSSTTGSFTGVACTFVNNDTDAMSMIEAVEATIEENNSYCIGSQSKSNSRRYNYIFKYENENKDKPKRMVIKVSNGNAVNGKFNIYIKKDQGEMIEHTDYTTLKEYGQNEKSKKSVIPYIVDVNILRNKTENDYVSKVLFYSQHLEMQMYYVPEDSNAPIKLFCGNIALVYTKPQLAIQKYHATTLVLISENIEGQDQSSLGNTFRFHTKMFKSDDQVEFFVSQNPDGRTLNFPLSLEMNTCTSENNKLYYILNYNKPESERTLHLDMIFGSYSRARIAREINAEKWDLLIDYSMTSIENYEIELPEKSQDIDVIEIECKSPLLINAYYSYDEYSYNNIKEGEMVVKELPSQNSFSFTIEKGSSPLFFYSMSLFNPVETPSVTVRFSDGTEHYISENSLRTGMLMFTPDKVTVINNSKSRTRFIFKIGFGVETTDDWKEVEEDQDLEGTLYSKDNKYVYKFPIDNNKRNFTNVTFLVNSLNEEDENVKFCYSTNLGIAIEASKENCFRTGKYIPYNLTFINPLIVAKNYLAYTDKYYISFRPFNDNDYINIEITEEQYEIKIRNDEGIHKLLTLSTSGLGMIFSYPDQETSKLIVQLKTCKTHSSPIEYTISNAFTKERIDGGKIYYSDKYGIIHFITKNKYLENEIQFSGQSGTTIFSKYSSINEDYSPNIKDYKTTFDSNTNSASIIKPIYDEEFTITVIVGLKGTLISITQCDLAFNDKSKYGDYSKTFTSISSNIITHYIDFSSLNYNEGTEFDLLVYAEQTYNSKMEFLYPVITGTVGKISGVLGITEYIEDFQYVTKTFLYSSTNNYLYYDFSRSPSGKIASLKIISSKAKVSKVGCVFTSKYATDTTMVNDVNKAVLEGKSVCLGEMQKDSDGYDALINANYNDINSRLVIQVLYGLGDENEKLKDGEDELVINIKVSGTDISESEGKFGTQEKLAPIPYVIDLLKIREKKLAQIDYVSKVLFYSNTREMEMFYIDEQSSAPVSLFTGNIMLVYTNEELINQKYHGATTMILLTDALSATERIIIGEQYRFMIKYFNSESQVQYYLSGNPDGRPLNNPTAIEMTSCSQPYYYILNYNQIEEERRSLHIDTIFGEKNTIKLATALNHETWDSLVADMDLLEGEQILLEKTGFHFDIIEVTCKLPLLLNLYYTDPDNTKVSNFDLGDISILSLGKGQSQTLYFKTGEEGPFAYSFNIHKENNVKPNIEIIFQDETNIEATENGLFIKDSLNNYEYLTIYNRDTSGSANTRIIFKFGYVIESTFEKIENNVYSNQNLKNRTVNLFGYKYDTTVTRLNITGVDFEVTTNEDNVKFCYSTNLGTFINPSLQNCYRVGKSNSYTISTLNPLIMYKNYYDEDVINYYVGFRTVEFNQNITIIPKIKKYDTTERNLEGAKNKIKISYTKTYSTILTAPKNNEPYIFTHIHVCTKDQSLSYQFLNAYNLSNLGYNGEIPANSKSQFKSIENIKLDTELKLFGEDGVEVFVRHVGISEQYQPIVKDIDADFDNVTRVFNWTQPIEDEEFRYTIYVDKLNNIRKQQYTICSIAEVSKLSHFSLSLQTNSNTPNVTIPDYGSDYKDIDMVIIAEQLNLGKLIIMSNVFDSNNEKPNPIPPSPPGPNPDENNNDKKNEGTNNNNVGLIVLIVILSVAIIAGAIFAFFIYRKYKGKGETTKKNKETSMALIKSTKNDKLIESQAQETDQIDP